MKRKILELLGFPLERIEFELQRSIEEIEELQSWAAATKNRLLELHSTMEEL